MFYYTKKVIFRSEILTVEKLVEKITQIDFFKGEKAH